MGRREQLDGLRGLAAFVVLLHHCSLVVPGFRDHLTDHYAPRLLVAGPQAVVLFFILSGFVLFEAWRVQAAEGHLAWMVRRSMRLLPPMVCCITISALVAAMIHPMPVPDASVWFNTGSWSGTLDGATWLRNVLPLGDDDQLDNVTWSLVHEVRISLVFPLIAVVVLRSPGVTLVAAFVLALLAPRGSEEPATLLWTSHFLSFFMAGALMARHRDGIETVLRRLPGRARALLFMGALAALVSTAGLDPSPGLVAGIGAIGLVVLCAFDERIASRLRHPVLIRLGRMSYSLYLIHLPVLLTVVHLFHDVLPVRLLVTAAIPLSIGIAGLIEMWVERPAQRLSRRLARRTAAAMRRFRPAIGPDRVLRAS